MFPKRKEMKRKKRKGKGILRKRKGNVKIINENGKEKWGSYF
jgi:hypothetical protein